MNSRPGQSTFCGFFFFLNAFQDKLMGIEKKKWSLCRRWFRSVFRLHFPVSLQECSHHTTGAHCDTCLPGYYGNATHGSPADCQPCSCPLNLPSNKWVRVRLWGWEWRQYTIKHLNQSLPTPPGSSDHVAGVSLRSTPRAVIHSSPLLFSLLVSWINIWSPWVGPSL